MSPTGRNLIILGFWCIGLWFFFAVFTPFLENYIPAWKRFNQIQEEQGLDTGALYYSNVPQTEEAEQAMREAVRKGMEARRKAKMEERKNGQ